MPNMINWFEIPVSDMERARSFYGSILSAELPLQDMGDFKMAYLPGDTQETVSGSLVYHNGSYTPSDHAGVLIYLNGGEDLQGILDKVEPAGGKILQAKRQISEEVGFMAIFLDSEGNRMALHSPT